MPGPARAGALIYAKDLGLLTHFYRTLLQMDIRSQEEFAKGHLAGAQHLLLSQIQSNNLGPVEKHKDAPIIVVCESGMTAGGAGRQLSKAGFKQVYVLSGGMAQWRADNLPVTKKR